MPPQSPTRRQIGSLQRFFLIVTGPLWLPVYWLIQLVLGLVGLANYIVLDRTLLSILPRALAGRINKINRRTIWPISLLLMPLAIICQMILALVGLFLWWHQSLGRWQAGLKGRFWSFFVGLIWQGVFLLILIGSYYHPLAWRVLGKELPLSLWYYLPTEPVSRQLLVGPLAWMAIVLLLLPILMAPLRRPWLCGLAFPLRIALEK